MEQTLREISGLQAKTQRDHSQPGRFTGIPLPELPPSAAYCDPNHHEQKGLFEMLEFNSAQPALQTEFLPPDPSPAVLKKPAPKQAKRKAQSVADTQLPLFASKSLEPQASGDLADSQCREENSQPSDVVLVPAQVMPAKIVAPDPFSITAAYLHETINTWTDLRPSQRAPLHTAVNHAETLLIQHRDKLGGHAPWSCAGLNRVLWPNGKRAVTLSSDVFRNAATSLRKIFFRIGLHADSRYGKNELSPPWKELYDDLPADDRRKSLIRFFRYLTLMDITPETVTPQALSDFYIWCDTQILHDDAAGLARRSASNWEEMRKAKQPGWPQVQLKWAGMRDQYALPFSLFPQSLNDEIDVFLDDKARLAARGLIVTELGIDVFASLAETYRAKLRQKEQAAAGDSDEASGGCVNNWGRQDNAPDTSNTAKKAAKTNSPRGHCRQRTERTIKTRRWQIQVAATALVLSGFPIEKITSLSVLVCPLENALIILDFHRKRMVNRLSEKGEEFGPDDVRSSHLQGVGEVLRQIGKYQSDMPESDMDELIETIAMVSPHAQFSMTDKIYRRLKALFEEPTYSMLLALPDHWMKLAKEPGRDPLDAARLVMYAAALEILLFLPLRRHNLLDLKLDSTLRRPAPGKLIDEIYLPAGKVKNRQEIRWPVDPEHASLLETYITKFRQLLAKDGNDYLFPGILDGHRDDAQFGNDLSTRVALAIGAEFNCHLVRHFAVVRYLRNNPRLL